MPLCLPGPDTGSLFLGGCASFSWQSAGSDLPVLDQESMHSDTPQAIDKELQQRFVKKSEAAKAMFSHNGDGRLVLHHKYGTTILPDQPKRVVVIGMEDPMVALGAPMVAAHDRPDSYLHEALSAQGVDNVYINDSTNTINLEQVQAEKPDFIILRDSYDRNAYVALSKIAPVAAFDLQDAETSLLAIAITLGQPERGDERLRQYYDVVKKARLAIKSRIGNSSVALVRVLKKKSASILIRETPSIDLCMTCSISILRPWLSLWATARIWPCPWKRFLISNATTSWSAVATA